jgi:hypothetical protein
LGAIQSKGLNSAAKIGYGHLSLREDHRLISWVWECEL